MTASDATCNYYQATRIGYASRPTLQGALHADVCVIGGGVAGCATALHLAQRGYRVVLLEAETIGSGASGRSGGQLLPGYSSGQAVLRKQLGAALAKQLWDASVAAVQLSTQLIQQHHIDCDLQFGHLDAALKPRQRDELKAYQAELHDYGYAMQLMEGNALHARVASQRYCAALHDPAAAQVHPLNYTLGIANAAQMAGAQLFEHSAAVRYELGQNITVHTQQGSVIAQHVALCANVGNSGFAPALRPRIMPVGTYIVATEPLGAVRAQALLPHNDALADVNFILDYFRRSADHRLLFGGRVSYSGRDFANTTAATRARMIQVFPQLKDVRIDYSWGGLLDITLNRAPDFGRLHERFYYLQGFSGHGMALAGFAGKLIADVIAGQCEQFDVYARLQHRGFPGGALLRTPALMLAMLWYRLRDLLP